MAVPHNLHNPRGPWNLHRRSPLPRPLSHHPLGPRRPSHRARPQAPAHRRQTAV